MLTWSDLKPGDPIVIRGAARGLVLKVVEVVGFGSHPGNGFLEGMTVQTQEFWGEDISGYSKLVVWHGCNWSLGEADADHDPIRHLIPGEMVEVLEGGMKPGFLSVGYGITADPKGLAGLRLLTEEPPVGVDPDDADLEARVERLEDIIRKMRGALS